MAEAARADGNAEDTRLRRTVLEIEAHVAAAGWDQPSRLYALVPTQELVTAEPALAARLGSNLSAAATFTPVEQEDVAARQLERLLAEICWPPRVAGCAAALERVVLPTGTEQRLLDEDADLERVPAEHPDRQEVRLVAAVTRDGHGHCAVRMRAYDCDDAVLDGPDLVPGLLSLLAGTLED